MTFEPARPHQRETTTRVEDAALLRGEGHFIGDLNLDGQLYGVFVRSEHAHARIRGVDLDAALAQDGVVAVLTADDIAAAGAGTVSRPPPQKGRDGTPMAVPHRPALAGEKVVHVGDPVALVVAASRAAAEDAAELVEVDYEPLPAVSRAIDAIGPDAPLIWPEAPGNIAIDWSEPDASEEAEVDRAIAGAKHVVRARIVNQRLATMPLEPRGATAVYDADADLTTLHTPSQSAHALRDGLCAIMGVERDRLRLISRDVGGSFGLKTGPYPEYVALMVAARKLGRPVHWMSTRSEAFLSDNQGRDQVSDATLALDGNGRFVALKVDAVTNLGAYVTASGARIATNNFAKCFPGMYDIPQVAIGVRLAFTNTLPTGPYRGAGRPEANYVMERLVDAAARETGIDPVELRRRNLIAAGAMPYRSAVGNTYDSGDFARAVGMAAERARIASFAERRAASERAGKLRGIGVSCFLEIAGGPPVEGAKLVADGERITLTLGMHATGQGHATVFGNLAADLLGLPPERVVVVEGDSDVPFRGGPAVGSRSTSTAGAAIVDGLGKLVEAASGLAAAKLGVDAAALTYRDGYFEVAETNHRVSLFDLAGSASQGGLEAVAQVDVIATFPNGCHIAEVEVDPETGKVTLIDYIAVDDCGVVLEPMLAEAQIAGGVAQGLGQALMEAVIYDEHGQLVTGSLTDYAVPRADDVIDITSLFSPAPARTNALGVKGIGEAGTTAAIGAVMNAIADAIPNRKGAEIDMPATPERVWRACQATG